MVVERAIDWFDAPSGIAVDRRGDAYVTDFYNHRVQKFTGDGQFVDEWGGRGPWRGRFRYPTGVAVTPAGDVVVADGFNHRVQRFVQIPTVDRPNGNGLGSDIRVVAGLRWNVSLPF